MLESSIEITVFLLGILHFPVYTFSQAGALTPTSGRAKLGDDKKARSLSSSQEGLIRKLL
jgi:hypothetical protein